ncbi:uncharacterized protein [Halyomorpha halys]|uniref:uncharacterized protein isoform X3 n=1 Tax=Halyomorpha halys TaxID=286706 RepID=UPI0006D515CD|nr:uncharacterized protein LOC106685664 isoform X3 [Halyomorpha halys]
MLNWSQKTKIVFCDFLAKSITISPGAPIRQVLQIRLMMDRASEIRSMEEEKFRRKIRHMRGLYTCSSNEQLHMFSPPPHSFVEGFLSCVPNYHGGGGDNACYNSSRGENVY